MLRRQHSVCSYSPFLTKYQKKKNVFYYLGYCVYKWKQFHGYFHSLAAVSLGFVSVRSRWLTVSVKKWVVAWHKSMNYCGERDSFIFWQDMRFYVCICCLVTYSIFDFKWSGPVFLWVRSEVLVTNRLPLLICVWQVLALFQIKC